MIKKYLLVLLPLFIVVISWIILRKSPFTLTGSDQLKVEAFTDQGIDDGNSKVLDLDKQEKEGISFQFELEEGFISPYAGVTLYEDSYLDLSDYSHAMLDLDLENTRNLELTITTYQNGVTRENELLSYRHNVREIPIKENDTQYSLSLQDFNIAQWWLENYKLRSTELGKADFSKARSISFVAKIRLDQEQPQMLRINKVTFYKDMTFFYIGAVTFLLVWYLVLFIFTRIFRKKKSSPELIIQYQHTNHPNKKDNYENGVLSYIAENYMDAELTLKKISEAFRSPEKTISSTIRKQSGLSFKELLNGVRIAEAKRLMLETDLNISEIAYKVGFNSPNHFNRTFKSREGITPTEFIQTNKVVTD